MSDSNECFFEGLAFTSKGLQIFSIIYTLFSGFLLVSGFSLWISRRDHVYLRKRGYVHLFFVSLAWFVSLLVGPVARSFRETVFGGCLPQAMMIGLILPCMTFPQALRVFQIAYNLRLNKEFAALLRENLKGQLGYTDRRNTLKSEGHLSVHEDDKDDASDATSIKGRLFIYKKLASNNFAAVFGVIALLLTIIQSFSYGASLCPEVGGSDCLVSSNGVDSTGAMLVLYLSTLFFALFIGILVYVVRDYEDPFDILYEFKLATAPTVLVLICFFVLSGTDPFNVLAQFDENDEIIPNEANFTYEVFLDVSILYFGVMTILLPAHKASKMKKKAPMNTNHITLKQVLEMENGEELFVKHLEAEFSLDNFCFYKRCLEWEAKYYSEKSRAIKKEAKFIYKNWVVRGSLLEVNLPNEITQAIYKDIKKRNYHIDLFKEAVENIYDLMANDSFLRFKDSERFSTLFENNNALFGSPKSPGRHRQSQTLPVSI